jgi:hypothetical protein
MVYFLGRDVDVYLFTESRLTTSGGGIGSSGSEVVTDAASEDRVFASAMASGGSTSNTIADFDKLTDITGVDVGIGATDEDITYVGQRIGSKVEIKKELTISLTRKKSDNLWDLIFNGPVNSTYVDPSSHTGGARWGFADNLQKVGDGNYNPTTIRTSTAAGGLANSGYGYRIAVVMKSGSTADGTTETVTVPNLVISGHTVSLNADGTTEETMEFSTTLNALYTIGTEFNNTLTVRTAM